MTEDGWLDLELPLENQLTLRNATDVVSKMKRAELEEMFLGILRQLLVQQSITKQLLHRVVILENK